MMSPPTAWYKRLGVTGVRIFGGAGALSTLQSFVGPSNWGKDLNGAAVSSSAAFQSAIGQARSAAPFQRLQHRRRIVSADGPFSPSQLRTPGGHISTSAAFAWANPPAIAALAANLANQTTKNGLVIPTGADLASTIAGMQAIAIEPLLVFCAQPPRPGARGLQEPRRETR